MLAGAVEAQTLSDLSALRLAPEFRCAPYDRADYPYPQSVEEQIVQAQGGAFSPYDGTVFDSLRDSDIEHIVATSEAHDSGLCAADAEVKKTFAQDLENLTLATPRLNRYEKSGKDAGEWLPEKNRCWFAQAVVRTKGKYDLSVDRREHDALHSILAESGELPGAAALSQNYPNPFNPSTEIAYELSAPEYVRLEVFDMSGRSVAVLADGMRAAGRHSVRFEAGGLPSGLYAYRLQVGGEAIARRMALVR